MFSLKGSKSSSAYPVKYTVNTRKDGVSYYTPIQQSFHQELSLNGLEYTRHTNDAVKKTFPKISPTPKESLRADNPEAYYTAMTSLTSTTNALQLVNLTYQSDCGKARARFQNLFNPQCLVYKTLATMALVAGTQRHQLDAAINYFDESFKPNSAEDAAHKLKQLEKLRDSTEGFPIMKANVFQLVEELHALDKAPTQDWMRIYVPEMITNEKFKEKVREFSALPSFVQPLGAIQEYPLALDPRTPWRIFFHALEKRLDAFPEDELEQFNGSANLSGALSRKEKKRKNSLPQGLVAEEDVVSSKKQRANNQSTNKKEKKCPKCGHPACKGRGRDCKSKTCADCKRKLEPGVYHDCTQREKPAQKSRDNDRKSDRDDTRSSRNDDRSYDREDRRPRRDSRDNVSSPPDRERERERSRSRDAPRSEDHRRVYWHDREPRDYSSPRREPPRARDSDRGRQQSGSERRPPRSYNAERNSEWDDDSYSEYY